MNPIDPRHEGIINRAIEAALKEKIQELALNAADAAAIEVRRQVIQSATEIARKVQAKLTTDFRIHPDMVVVEIRLAVGGGK